MGNLKPYTCHIPLEDYERLENLVKLGLFSHKGEAIREAVHQLCDKYERMLNNGGRRQNG